jgi:uroporphyrinogen-III synthase
MSEALARETVIVTRPVHQLAALSAQLRARGARVVEFPTIDVEPAVAGAAGGTAVPDDFDWVIYTSANAVTHATNRLPKPARARVAAVGPATARALAAAGIEVAALPVRSADSEGLLALPAFAAPCGLRILIVRGADGRGLLARELTRRGATVETAELYRRVPVTPSAAALGELTRALAATRAPIVIVTSVEVLAALLSVAPAEACERLKSVPLLVPGARVATAARELGWRGPMRAAASAQDGALVAALEDWIRDAGTPKDA